MLSFLKWRKTLTELRFTTEWLLLSAVPEQFLRKDILFVKGRRRYFLLLQEPTETNSHARPIGAKIFLDRICMAALLQGKISPFLFT